MVSGFESSSMYLRRSNAAPEFFSSQLYLQNQHSEIVERILGPSASARLRIGFRRGSVQERNLPKERPSENYGNEEHTTVAAFLPWRGL